mmetsp:Transcript_19980/g.59004  ORF Transcript_19980/g.59004 Transcript_19980/m.59004 type:complete len:256 (-) Transcript_19980:554-1321(-)
MPAAHRGQARMVAISTGRTWLFAGAAAGTFVGWVIYRTVSNDRTVRDLSRRMDELQAHVRSTKEALEGLRVTVRAASTSRQARSSARISTCGSFESAMDLEPEDRVDTARSNVEASEPVAHLSVEVAPRGVHFLPQTPELPLDEADRLFDESKHNETIAVLGGPQVLAQDSADRIWRMARAMHVRVMRRVGVTHGPAMHDGMTPHRSPPVPFAFLPPLPPLATGSCMPRSALRRQSWSAALHGGCPRAHRPGEAA